MGSSSLYIGLIVWKQIQIFLCMTWFYSHAKRNLDLFPDSYIERRRSKNALYSWSFTIFRGRKFHFHRVFIIVIRTKICDFEDKKCVSKTGFKFGRNELNLSWKCISYIETTLSPLKIAFFFKGFHSKLNEIWMKRQLIL